MCDGNCDACPVQCSASKIIDKFKNKAKEKQEMSETILSCKSTDGEKVAVHGAWIDGTKKTIFIIGIGVAVIFGGLWYLNGKISDVKFNAALEIEKVKTSSEIRIKNLEEQVKELKNACEKAERDYASARSSISQYRRKARKEI